MDSSDETVHSTGPIHRQAALYRTKDEGGRQPLAASHEAPAPATSRNVAENTTPVKPLSDRWRLTKLTVVQFPDS